MGDDQSFSATLAEKTRFLRTGGETGRNGGGAGKEIVFQYREYWSCMSYSMFWSLWWSRYYVLYFLSFPFIGCRV